MLDSAVVDCQHRLPVEVHCMLDLAVAGGQHLPPDAVLLVAAETVGKVLLDVCSGLHLEEAVGGHLRAVVELHLG